MRFPFIFSRLAAILAAMLFAASLHAQTPDTTTSRHWKIGIETGLGATQASYSDNWTGGESGTIIWVSNFRGTADKQLSHSLFFGNELKLEFGQTHTQIDSTKQWQSPKKSADKIRYNNILRLTRGWAVDPYAAGAVESQFVNITDTSKIYYDPADFTEALGVARDVFNVPDQRALTTRVGFGLRQHLRRGFKTANDGGVEWVTDLSLGSPKAKYSFVSKVTVFEALFNSEADRLKQEDSTRADYWKTADLNWDNTLRANLTSVLQVNLGWQLLYDKEIDLGGRFKETLALGLSYKFATK
jgi:hypothetical protein